MTYNHGTVNIALMVNTSSNSSEILNDPSLVTCGWDGKRYKSSLGVYRRVSNTLERQNSYKYKNKDSREFSKPTTSWKNFSRSYTVVRDKWGPISGSQNPKLVFSLSLTPFILRANMQMQKQFFKGTCFYPLLKYPIFEMTSHRKPIVTQAVKALWVCQIAPPPPFQPPLQKLLHNMHKTI